MTDLELLGQYSRERSDDAFAELVRRHVDWVYSACRRQVRDAALAEDVTQSVFITLARKASGLSDSVSISGWLFSTARYASAAALKIEGRRRLHERQAATMKHETIAQDVEQHWRRIEPVLDKALARLGASDREVVILRFFRGMSHEAIGVSLQISEEAAKKRVTRAIGRLRKTLGSAATVLSAADFAAVLCERATQPAPLQLAQKSVAALKSGMTGRTELIVKWMSVMQKILATKIIAGTIAAALLIGATASLAIVHQHPRPAPLTLPIAEVSTTPIATLPPYDIASVKVFKRSVNQNGFTWTEWQSPGNGVVQRMSAHGWTATHLFIGGSEWVYRDGGNLILRKKPIQDADALIAKLQSDLTSLQHAPATRASELDAAVDNVVCQAYRLSDSRGKAKKTVVYIDPQTHRPARMTDEEPAFDATISYDPPTPDTFFKLASLPSVEIVNSRDYFEKKYPIGEALFTKRTLGQVFAVHEATQDSNGCYHIICSSRVAPDFRSALGELPDDQDLTKFMMDDRAELPFHYLTLAEFHESGMQVSYLLAIPEKSPATKNFCQLPVTAASADALLTAARVHYSAHSGHDVHFVVALQVPFKPNARTLRDFAARAYDEAVPLVGLVASQTDIGPRTDSGISNKDECVAEMEKQLAKYVNENRKEP